MEDSEKPGVWGGESSVQGTNKRDKKKKKKKKIRSASAHGPICILKEELFEKSETEKNEKKSRGSTVFRALLTRGLGIVGNPPLPPPGLLVT